MESFFIHEKYVGLTINEGRIKIGREFLKINKGKSQIKDLIL